MRYGMRYLLQTSMVGVGHKTQGTGPGVPHDRVECASGVEMHQEGGFRVGGFLIEHTRHLQKVV